MQVTGDTCIQATPVAPEATHSVTAQAATTTPPLKSSRKTYHAAAANDTDAAMGMLMLTGDSFVQFQPQMPLDTGTTVTWPTGFPTTHVPGGTHTCSAVVAMLLFTESMQTSNTPAQGRMNPSNFVPCELAVSVVICRCWVEGVSRVAVIDCLA